MKFHQECHSCRRSFSGGHDSLIVGRGIDAASLRLELARDGSRLDSPAIEALFNHLPVVNAAPGNAAKLPALADQTLAEGDTLTIDLNTAFTDPDWLRLDPASGTLSTNPDFYAQGDYALTLQPATAATDTPI